LQQILTQVFLVSISIIAILAFDARLFIFLFAILIPPAILVFYFLKKKISAARDGIKKENESSYRHLLDALKGYVESNIFGKNAFFMDRFMHHRRSFAKELYRSLSLQQFPSRAIEIFAVLGLFILIILAKSQSGANTDLLLIIGAFIAASYKIIPGIVKIINLAGLARAYKFNPAELAGPGALQKNIPVKLPVDSISIDNIYFSYGELPVIKGLSLQAEKGDFIGISGLSGKGKTTLMNIILGFLSPTAGKIMINGNEMTTEEIKKYWPSVSYVKQQPFLINDTLIRNITLEETVSDQYALSRAIQMTGTGSMMKDYPENEEKIITENGKNISGGQQQRIAIARAFYNKADLLILDEPFNELDEASALLIMEELAAMAGAGKIIILIAHDKKILSLCHKIISLDGAVIKNLAGA
jgi:ABC-type bacteriocin/lantibiotic exporter with double-glycine peptidase domain